MKIIDPGHVFDLDWLDGNPQVFDPFEIPAEWRERVFVPTHSVRENRLIFVKREGEKYPGNVGHHAGTQIQEVLRAIISRIKYVDEQIPDPSNRNTIDYLRRAFISLEQRAARRHGRAFPMSLWFDIEDQPTCRECGHVGCPGGCHDESENGVSKVPRGASERNDVLPEGREQGDDPSGSAA
jgi:hypothetical protein